MENGRGAALIIRQLLNFLDKPFVSKGNLLNVKTGAFLMFA